MLRLNLSQNESSQIGLVARENKPFYKNSSEKEKIYESNVSRLSLFCDYYMLLSIIINHEEINKEETIELKNKLINYKNQFSDLYKKISIKLSELLKGIDYGEEEIINSLNNIFNENSEIIELLISEFYPLGKVIRKFDPDESFGAY